MKENLTPAPEEKPELTQKQINVLELMQLIGPYGVDADSFNDICDLQIGVRQKTELVERGLVRLKEHKKGIPSVFIHHTYAPTKQET